VVVLASSAHGDVLRIRGRETAALGAAMGMQNSLVTRLSGAVVRTTHLTGVVTDIGIEIARWLRWSRAALARRSGEPRPGGRAPAERPSVPKMTLLVTIAGAFGAGAVAGAYAALAAQSAALAAPAVALLGGATLAFRSRNAR